MTQRIDLELKLPTIAFATLLSFIDALHVAGVPSRLDRQHFRKMSSSGHANLLRTLRFLGLCDDQDCPTMSLRRLTSARRRPEWSAVLRGIIETSYEAVLRGVPLKSAKARELCAAVQRAGGLEGDALDRASRFLVGALHEAKFACSAAIHVRWPRVAKPRRKSAIVADSDCSSGLLLSGLLS